MLLDDSKSFLEYLQARITEIAKDSSTTYVKDKVIYDDPISPVAGIDILSDDISIPWYENGAIVNEVNVSPSIGASGVSKKYLQSFLENIIDGDGRIPIIEMNDFEKALEIQEERMNEGIYCVVTTNVRTIDGIGNDRFLNTDSLEKRIEFLLNEKLTEEIIKVV